jgi:crotonobetainyl-CoA:carnitine CoA-transferase CaiB-like acyl-CoA transferase
VGTFVRQRTDTIPNGFNLWFTRFVDAMSDQQTTHSSLENLRVLDVATLFAGPLAAMLLVDFGADVIKVEHPRGDPDRNHGYKKDQIPLWWKVISRGKRAVSLNLSYSAGQELFAIWFEVRML